MSIFKTPADTNYKSDPWVMRIGAMVSMTIMAFILTLISMTSFIQTQNTNERSNCLRPFTYAVDAAFGDVFVSVMDTTERTDEQRKADFKVAVTAYTTALEARAQAVKAC